MSMTREELLEKIEPDPWKVPLEEMDPCNPFLFAADQQGHWFKRLRDGDPVHFCPSESK